MSKSRTSEALLIGCLLLCVGCTPAAPPAWGDPVIVATAYQSEPPACQGTSDETVCTWVGSDARGVHHDARTLDGESVTLPLPPRQPHAQKLISGPGNAVHLLWLDADEDGVTQLYAALLRNLVVVRGPTQVSDRPVYAFDAAADASGGVLIAYSGGPAGEPSLRLTGVDSEGRPIALLDEQRAGNYPSFVRAENDLELMWLDVERQVILSSAVGDVRLSPIPLVPTIAVGSGDRLLDIRAAGDRTHRYVFWNVERSSGERQTWIATSPRQGQRWSQAALLTGRVDSPQERLQTGFNTGSAEPAQAGGTPLTLAAPLSEMADVVPVAGQQDGELVIFYLRGGQVVGRQLLATDVILLAPPTLTSDRDRTLYLSWSQAQPDGSAALRYLSSQRSRVSRR